MTELKGKCKHGEFTLKDGCQRCMAEKYDNINSPSGVAERVKEANQILHLVKVKYYSETTGVFSEREYTYFSADPLKLGDIITVPVRDTVAKAQVSAVDVPEAEIEAFKDKVKIIPSGSMEQEEIEAEAREQKTMERLTGIGEEVDMSTDELEEDSNAVDVPEAEIEAFKDKVKIIPSGTKITELYVMPEEMRGVKISPNAAISIVNDIVDVLIESEQPTQATAALALRPGEDVEAHNYFSEAMGLLKYAEGRVIKTLQDAQMATNDLSIIGKLKKAMEAKRKEKLAPHEAQVKAIRDTYTYLMTPILEAERVTKSKQGAFLQEQERIRREQEEINRKRMEAAEAEMKLKGELTEPVNLVEVIEPAKRVSTELGTSGLTDHWVFEVVDFSLLPNEYKVVDSAMLNAIAKKHHDLKSVPGIRFFNQPYLATRTK